MLDLHNTNSRTMLDLHNTNLPIGGCTILFLDDFCQNLPVVTRGACSNGFNASLKSSYLWPYVIKLELKTNMRVLLSTEENRLFADLLLKIGNGQLPQDNGGINHDNDNLLMHQCKPTTLDTALDPYETVHYPTELINSLQPPGLPPHKLVLKVGFPIILLQIKSLKTFLIECTILTSCGTRETILITWIPLIPTDLTFQLKQLQFPVRLSFSMTINKAQGQTLNVARIDISPFHMTSRENLFVLSPVRKALNVVYKEIL
ncbi:hypothetical protein PR048_015890 [Dryococelus australis]|uniref:ATP-dependent DNA helicase n=1 Tax=Dryococelus australis TaxID=614101 RepID=A0ABQ9HJB7_9NEOP|nr:hypothetical protein PR048_015890 [Dryococelus australis]